MLQANLLICSAGILRSSRSIRRVYLFKIQSSPHTRASYLIIELLMPDNQCCTCVLVRLDVALDAEASKPRHYVSRRCISFFSHGIVTCPVHENQPIGILIPV